VLWPALCAAGTPAEEEAAAAEAEAAAAEAEAAAEEAEAAEEEAEAAAEEAEAAAEAEAAQREGEGEEAGAGGRWAAVVAEARRLGFLGVVHHLNGSGTISTPGCVPSVSRRCRELGLRCRHAAVATSAMPARHATGG
jgi:hypothetical protein